MKIRVLSVLFAGVMLWMGNSVFAQRAVKPTTGEIVTDKIVMYIPNRIMDLLDIVTFDLETGAAAKLGVRLTYACGIGGEIGCTGQFAKDCNRTLGFCQSRDRQVYFLASGTGELMRSCVFGNLPDYWYSYSGMRMPSDPVFQTEKAKDYWSIELKAVALAGGRVSLHPLHIADFICGIFCYDLLNNDYKLLID